MHPVHQLMAKKGKSEQDRVLCAAIMVLSTEKGFAHLTWEEVWEKLQVAYKEITESVEAECQKPQ